MTSKEEYDNLEKAIMHYWGIGEVLIDVSKGYISEDIALKKIKEYMRIADVFTHRDLKQIKKDLEAFETLILYYKYEIVSMLDNSIDVYSSFARIDKNHAKQYETHIKNLKEVRKTLDEK